MDIPPDNPPPDPLDDDPDPYPPLSDPMQQPAEFLRVVVDELNPLHEATAHMVVVWPRTTDLPS
ncbi:hypothetical protein [Rhodococcus ruber]|uniref:hypothetical protein n=1 Tax=Rhodococcus ruber TaxID=1830 RepID=UPI00111D46CD|nr:hypothetical protein [Rhodococcus ruber]QDC17350.1 hypothetical protein E2561_24470 [Rhodococcus ruber]